METTKVGTVLNGLSHLRGVTRKGEFVLSLIRGLGGNLTLGNVKGEKEERKGTRQKGEKIEK